MIIVKYKTRIIGKIKMDENNIFLYIICINNTVIIILY
jgi:hypothetical protein